MVGGFQASDRIPSGSPMRGIHTHTLITALRILCALVAFVLGALVFYAGEPSHLRWWMGGLPFALWVIGPAVVPCLIANHKSQQWFSITMFLYLAVSSIFSGFAYYDAFFRSKSSTAALTLVFIPFYQWLAIALLLLLCLGIRRGRRSVGNGC
jgi:uncharacterized Tic20 family protein